MTHLGGRMAPPYNRKADKALTYMQTGPRQTGGSRSDSHGLWAMADYNRREIESHPGVATVRMKITRGEGREGQEMEKRRTR